MAKGSECSSEDQCQEDGGGNKSRRLEGKAAIRALAVCGCLLVFYMCGYISYIPLNSQYVRNRVTQAVLNRTNTTINDNDNFCFRNSSAEQIKLEVEIQKESSDLLLYYTLPGNVMAVIVNLFLGSYSDFLGRRTLFLLPFLGAAVKNGVFCFIIGFDLNLNWFYLGGTIEGMFGGFTAFLLAVFSYTADVTAPGRTRTLMIAFMEGLLAIAGSLGQLAIGFIIQKVNFLYAAIPVTCIFLLGALIMLLFLPETMVYTKKRQWSPLPHIKRVFSFFFTRGTGRRKAMYIIGMFTFYFGVIVNLGRTSVETLYQLDRPFCWSPTKIGYFGAIRLSFGVLCSLAGLKLMQPCLKDMTIALIGLVFGIASFIVEGLAVNDWMLYSVPVIGFISFNVVPVARATMSKMTSPLEQGALFSSIAVMETICNTMSNSLYTAVYQSTVGVFRGAVFMTMAGFGVIASCFVIAFLIVSRGQIMIYEPLINEEKVIPEDEQSTHADNCIQASPRYDLSE